MVKQQGLVRVEGKPNGAKYRDIIKENLVPSVQDLWLGQGLIFQQDNDPKHTANACDWNKKNVEP